MSIVNVLHSKDAINSNYKFTRHGGMYSAHSFGKISQNIECCNADFWQVRRIGLSRSSRLRDIQKSAKSPNFD